MQYSEIFPIRLRQARLDAGLLQRELAKKAYVTPGGVSFYESGKRQPSTETLVQLAKVLNVSADWLLGLSDEVRK